MCSTTTTTTAAASPSQRAEFDRRYQSHLKHLRLKGLQPKTIDAYARGVRRMGEYFDQQIDALTGDQLSSYFSDLLDTHSWSSVKLDLYGYKFYTQHVLGQPWVMPQLVRAPKVQRLPDIVTVEEAARVFAATRCLSYRVFFFTLYSMGLRLGEGLGLRVGDIDAVRARVHVRDAKGNRDRLVPLPSSALAVLRRFWGVHRNPVWLFPARQGGALGAHRAQTPLDRGGVQKALHQVVQELGLKKTSALTAFATAMPRT
jgi:site-specific recombinase XerD